MTASTGSRRRGAGAAAGSSTTRSGAVVITIGRIAAQPPGREARAVDGRDVGGPAERVAGFGIIGALELGQLVERRLRMGARLTSSPVVSVSGTTLAGCADRSRPGRTPRSSRGGRSSRHDDALGAGPVLGEGAPRGVFSYRLEEGARRASRLLAPLDHEGLDTAPGSRTWPAPGSPPWSRTTGSGCWRTAGSTVEVGAAARRRRPGPGSWSRRRPEPGGSANWILVMSPIGVGPGLTGTSVVVEVVGHRRRGGGRLAGTWSITVPDAL